MSNLPNINSAPQPSAKADSKAAQGFQHLPAKPREVKQSAHNPARGKAHGNSSVPGKENGNPVAQKNTAPISSTQDIRAAAGKAADALAIEPFAILLARQIDGVDAQTTDSAQATIATQGKAADEKEQAISNDLQDPSATAPEAALAAMLIQLPQEKRPLAADDAADAPAAGNGKTSGINIAAFNAATRSDSSAVQPDAAKPDPASRVSAKQDFTIPDTAKPDPVKQGLNTADAAKQSSIKPELNTADAAKLDIIRQGLKTADAAQTDSARQGLNPPDTAKPDAIRQAFVMPEAVKPEAAKPDMDTPASAKPGLAIADIVSATPEKIGQLAMMPDKQVMADVLTRDAIKQAEVPPGLLQPGASSIAHAVNSPAISAVMPNMQPLHGTASASQKITTPVGASGWAEDFSQKISWISTQRNQVAELHLNPPDLGPLNVVLKISDNQATALFTSPHTAVRDAIENALPKLRETLADNGITLGNATVSDQPPRDRGREEFMDRNTGSTAQNQPSGDELQPGRVSASAVENSPIRRHLGMVDTFA